MALTYKIKLDIQPLCDKAFADIKNKVSLNNVVEEVFSWVTAGWVQMHHLTIRSTARADLFFSQEKIMEMQCELLVSNFKDPKTIAHMKENIRRISNGSSSHCTRALKLGFKKALDLKKKGNCVSLQCSYTGCAWYAGGVLYSGLTARFDPYCQTCRGRAGWKHYLQCVGCKSLRTISCASCQSCGKRFL